MEINKLLKEAALKAGFNKIKIDQVAGLDVGKVYVMKKSNRLTLCVPNLDILDITMHQPLAASIAKLVGVDKVGLWPLISIEGWTEACKCCFLNSLRLWLGEKSFLLQGAIQDICLEKQTLTLILHSQPALDMLEKTAIKTKLKDSIKRSMPFLTSIKSIYREDIYFGDQLKQLECDRLDCLNEINAVPLGQRDCVPGKILMGREIKGKPVAMVSVTEEERSLVLEGKVHSLMVRTLRSGRSLVTFDLMDIQSGISVKFFQEEKERVSAALKNDIYVKVRGSLQQDRYSQELTMMVKDINQIIPETRMDIAKTKRTELHLHTQMSALDGLTDLESVMRRAVDWNHTSLAITDHGGVQAFPNAHSLKKKHGWDLKIIYGMEAYYVDDEKNKDPKAKPHHLILLVKSEKGFENLYKLITSSNLNHFYRKPRVVKSELDHAREGLIVGSACEAGELFQSILQKKSLDEIEEIARYYDFLEVQPVENNEFMVRKGIVRTKKDIQDINRKIVELGEKLDIPVVATGDVHFLDPADELYRRIIQGGQGYSDTIQPPLYFKTTDEMLACFNYFEPAIARKLVIDNPSRVAGWVEDNLNPVQTELHTPKIEGSDEEIRLHCQNKATEIYGSPLPDLVYKRLERELKSIIENGFSVLYLIAEKLVKKSNEDGYLVGSRGSVGSSFVATMLGITEVNPLVPHYVCSNCQHSEFFEDGSIGSGADLASKDCPVCGQPLTKDGHEIPFETFLGFNGDKIPDIDLNFSGAYQSIIHKYTEVLFGEKNVFKAGTISTIADKTAFGFAKKFLEEEGRNTTRNAEISALASGCAGVKRTTGQHPGGIIVLPKGENINRFTPLQRPAEDTHSEIVTSHFDYHSIDASLVKLDLLGHDDPTAIKMLEDLTGTDARAIPLDDQATLSLFSSASALNLDPYILEMDVGSLGIPEFGTRFVRKMLADTRPTAFSELVRISGFSHGTDVWINNAQDLIISKTAVLADAISTRDDIMSYLLHRQVQPLIAFRIMEDVRKGKGLKPEYEKTMKDHEVPDWYITSCKKIKYMFPKAHAVAYVTMAFRIAWYKINYPAAFYAVYFSVRATEFELETIASGPQAIKESIQKYDRSARPTAREKNIVTILEIALEMYARGITLLPLDIYESAMTDFVIKGQSLLPPLNSIPGLGLKAANTLIDAREKSPFMSVEDLRVRSRVSSTVIDKMRAMGMLEGMPESEQMSLFV